MRPAAAMERVRCRLITEDDLPAVAELLCEGFPGRARAVWEAGLTLLKMRELPQSVPRYGYCLSTGDRLVGVILLISSNRLINATPVVFTNVASWYVNEIYRAYAQLLVSVALRNKDTTYTNVSPAPHTWPIVENQGYTRYCGGLFFAFGLLTRPLANTVIKQFDHQQHGHLADSVLLRRHQDMGCDAVVAEEPHMTTGFVFRRYRVRGGRLPMPAMFAIHAPAIEDITRLAGNLSRHFLSRAAPMIVLDADRPIDGLTGFYTTARGRKYFRGPHQPAHCQLADSEFAIFGV